MSTLTRKLCEEYGDKIEQEFADWIKDAYCGWDRIPGWNIFMYPLLCELRRTVDRAGAVLRMAQYKEKFGTIRFYYSLTLGPNEDGWTEKSVDHIVNTMEQMSEVTCITCGSPGQLIPTGWHRVHCDECELEYQKRFDK